MGNWYSRGKQSIFPRWVWITKPKDSAYQAALPKYALLKMLFCTRVLVDKTSYCILLVTWLFENGFSSKNKSDKEGVCQANNALTKVLTTATNRIHLFLYSQHRMWKRGTPGFLLLTRVPYHPPTSPPTNRVATTLKGMLLPMANVAFLIYIVHLLIHILKIKTLRGNLNLNCIVSSVPLLAKFLYWILPINNRCQNT